MSLLMNNATHFASRDFTSKTVRALAKKGIRIIGICAIPDMSHPMPYANASRGYNLDDNGTHKIRSHKEVAAIEVA